MENDEDGKQRYKVVMMVVIIMVVVGNRTLVESGIDTKQPFVCLELHDGNCGGNGISGGSGGSRSIDYPPGPIVPRCG